MFSYLKEQICGRHLHLTTSATILQSPKGIRIMGNDTQTRGCAKHPAKPRTFLSLAAEYQLAADSESTALMDDASLFLECACEMVSTIANGLESETSAISANPKSAAVMLYGVRRFIEMTMSNVAAVNRRLIAAKFDRSDPA